MNVKSALESHFQNNASEYLNDANHTGRSDEIIRFLQRLGYATTKYQAGGGNKGKQKKKEKLRVGPRGGKYVIRGGKKVYV